VSNRRVVGVGRASRRLVMVTEKRDGSVRGVREDGTTASFPRNESAAFILRSIVCATTNRTAFDEVRERVRELVLHEPRLRDAYAEETDALKVLDDTIENLLPPHSTAPSDNAAPNALGVCTKPPKIMSALHDVSRRCAKKFGSRSSSVRKCSLCLVISTTEAEKLPTAVAGC
jgi:hypothetical protein